MDDFKVLLDELVAGGMESPIALNMEDWSKGWIIEDCEISDSKCASISPGKYLDLDNDNYFTCKYVKSPTQMERDAVCCGQYHGWLKEKVGGAEIAGIKMHAAIDVIMRRCRSPLYTLPYSSSHRGYGLYDDSSW